MTDPSFYLLRGSSGEYDLLSANLKNMKKHALLGVEYGRDFERHASTGFSRIKGDGKKNTFSSWVFGEIADKAVGTVHQASGNHYLGKAPYKLIDDSTKVRDIFMLKTPTDASRDLAYLFDLQLSVLNTIRLEDEQAEVDNGETVQPLEWIRHSDPSRAANLICIHMGPKYELPPSIAKAKSSQKRTNSGKRAPRVLVDAPTPSTAPAPDDAKPSIPPPGDIKLNALYDPRLLPDYGGPVFNHHLAKLKQRNIVDASDNLIPPWDEYAALRPGTVVLMKVTLHTYSIDTDRGIGKKIYQIYCERIKILLPSYEPVWTRPIRALANSIESLPLADASDNDDECLKCFSKLAAATTSSSAASTAAAHPDPPAAKKAKTEPSPSPPKNEPAAPRLIDLKGKGRQMEA